MEREEAAIAKQGRDKHVSVETGANATIEDAVLSMRAFVAGDMFPQQRVSSQ
jgi:hypothetical protein